MSRTPYHIQARDENAPMLALGLLRARIPFAFGYLNKWPGFTAYLKDDDELDRHELCKLLLLCNASATNGTISEMLPPKRVLASVEG